METIIVSFLRILRIPISSLFCRRLILSHPDYPSILCIADTFGRLGISHSIYRTDLSGLEQTSYPYLLYLSKQGGEIVLVKDRRDFSRIKADLRYWDGTIIQAEATGVILDKTNKELYTEEQHTKLLAVTMLVLTVFVFTAALVHALSYLNGLLVVTSSTGLIFGSVATAKSLGIKNNTIDSFCGDGKLSDCDTTIKNSGNDLFGLAKFSDLVVAYFTVQLITIFFSLTSAIPTTVVLGVFGLLSFPFVLYSMYYQALKVKALCKICIWIDAILIAQAVLIASVLTKTGELTIGVVELKHIIVFGTIFIIFASLIIVVRLWISRMTKFLYADAREHRIKYTSSVFLHQLARQPQIDPGMFIKDIFMGNPDAPLKLVLVTNLYCNPCKEQHEVIRTLLTMFPDKVNVSVRFYRSANDYGRPLTTVQCLIQYWLTHIDGKPNASERTHELLHHWFAEMNYDKFVKSHKVDLLSIDPMGQQLEEQHYAWGDKSEISSTPTFFLNGYLMPGGYTVDDLMLMIPGLTEYMQLEPASPSMEI